ncbi:tegument protein VP13/14 [Spheniscid alphaherpesvirus 1]|uniref:Tegument protein UL47 n=1 Tax=Spheniscid alphaherpesvirus 1 TaxID=2560777 RepID=A0A1R3T7T6_9ALPH|nr:tegument protein VP13/14 [Spheniscid alphaherpesvirus 1]
MNRRPSSRRINDDHRTIRRPRRSQEQRRQSPYEPVPQTSLTVRSRRRSGRQSDVTVSDGVSRGTNADTNRGQEYPGMQPIAGNVDNTERGPSTGSTPGFWGYLRQAFGNGDVNPGQQHPPSYNRRREGRRYLADEYEDHSTNPGYAEDSLMEDSDDDEDQMDRDDESSSDEAEDNYEGETDPFARNETAGDHSHMETGIIDDPDQPYDDDWAVRVGRGYRPPAAMSNEDDDAAVLDEADYRTSPPPDAAPRLLPCLKGSILLADLLERIPWTTMLRGMRDAEANSEDKLWLTRSTFYGKISAWPSNDIQYPSGNMYFAKTPIPYGLWMRTARQSYATIFVLTVKSLQESVTKSHISHTTAIEFVLDSAVRIAVNCHSFAKKFKRLRVRQDNSGGADRVSLQSEEWYARNTYLRPVNDSAARLFARDKIGPARGAVAAILRSSYGSLIFWPHIREAIQSPGRKYLRYVLANIQDADVALMARCDPKKPGLLKNERDIIAICLTVGASAMERALQFLYASLGYRLHPGDRDPEYTAVLAHRPFLFLPMGSETLMNAESEVMESLLDNVSGGTIAIGSTVVMAYYAMRSSMTELMSELIEAHDAENGETFSSVLAAYVVILQRFLGHLNMLTNVLAWTSLYGGQKVNIHSDALLRYSTVMKIAAPLYTPKHLDEFWKEREQVMRDLALTPRHDSPPITENAVKSVPPLIDLSTFPPRGTDRGSMLGPEVPFTSAIAGAREVVLGETAMKATHAHVTGRRAMGISGRRMRY